MSTLDFTQIEQGFNLESIDQCMAAVDHIFRHHEVESEMDAELKGIFLTGIRSIGIAGALYVAPDTLEESVVRNLGDIGFFQRYSEGKTAIVPGTAFMVMTDIGADPNGEACRALLLASMAEGKEWFVCSIIYANSDVSVLPMVVMSGDNLHFLPHYLSGPMEKLGDQMHSIGGLVGALLTDFDTAMAANLADNNETSGYRAYRLDWDDVDKAAQAAQAAQEPTDA